jgi:hypothetical protein
VETAVVCIALWHNATMKLRYYGNVTQALRHISIVASRHTILDVYSCSLTGRTVYYTGQYYLCNSYRIVKIKRLISVTVTMFILNTVSYRNIN